MPPQFSRPLLFTVLAMAWAGGAQAETSPYYIGATAGISRDSNIFRLPSAIGDSFTSLGVLGGFDQPIGRQRVYASGNLRNNRYNELKQLDYTSYGVNAGLDWSTVERLSGSLNFTGNQNLINYGGLYNNSLTTARIIEKSNQSVASVQYGLASLLVLQGSFTRRSLTYSDPAYNQANGLTQDTFSVGINYQPKPALTVGAALRQTSGDYVASVSRFNRHDIDLTATWVPSGLSTVNARISRSTQDATFTASGNDFSGTTGYLSWTYLPTGKLTFNTFIARDTGAESGFINFNGQQITGVGNTSRITDTVSVDASYLFSAKIRLSANVQGNHRSLVSGALQGTDALRRVSLGASYDATRNIRLTCNLARETRSASNQLSSPYGDTTASCAAQIVLQ